MDPRIRTALISIDPNSERPAYHGAPTALGVLRGVSAKAAVWRPYAGANNIREIALHIAIYENALANRLSGKNVFIARKQWKFGWVVRVDEISEETWKADVELIKATRARLAEAVERFDPALLDQPVGKKTIIPAGQFIHGVGEHSLYHTAQLEMTKTLAKIQGLEG